MIEIDNRNIRRDWELDVYHYGRVERTPRPVHRAESPVLFRELITELTKTRAEKGLEEWISDSDSSSLAKLQCLNFYLLLLSETIQRARMIGIAEDFSRHLSARRSVPPQERSEKFVENAIGGDGEFLWKGLAPSEKVPKSLACIKSQYDIQRLLEYTTGRPMSPPERAGKDTLNDILSELYLSGEPVALSGKHGVLWVTAEETIKSGVGSGVDATVIRDMLGLAHLAGHLVAIIFEPTTKEPFHQPNLFHADFYRFFLNALPFTARGAAMNLSTFRPDSSEYVGIARAVSVLTWRELGSCPPFLEPETKTWEGLMMWFRKSISSCLMSDPAALADFLFFTGRWT